MGALRAISSQFCALGLPGVCAAQPRRAVFAGALISEARAIILGDQYQPDRGTAIAFRTNEDVGIIDSDRPAVLEAE